MAFIIKPWVTEKMTKITDKQPNRYGFVVRPEANKLTQALKSKRRH